MIEEFKKTKASKLWFPMVVVLVVLLNVSYVKGDEFKDNGNGTVANNDTKLMWQREGSDMMKWEPAISYCENLSLAGYDDWRLPNRNELESIVQQNKTYFLTKSCPSCPGYWTSTTVSNDASYAWRVNLVKDDSSRASKSFSGYARCVRGGQ